MLLARLLHITQTKIAAATTIKGTTTTVKLRFPLTATKVVIDPASCSFRDDQFVPSVSPQTNSSLFVNMIRLHENR